MNKYGSGRKCAGSIEGNVAVIGLRMTEIMLTVAVIGLGRPVYGIESTLLAGQCKLSGYLFWN